MKQVITNERSKIPPRTSFSPGLKVEELGELKLVDETSRMAAIGRGAGGQIRQEIHPVLGLHGQ
jgi:hypothetical protein